MVKSRDAEGAGKKLGPPAKRAAGSPVKAAANVAGEPAGSSRPTRRQVRQIARLVGHLEALGELEARRRRQLQVALEKGRKTKRHRQQVDRAAGRVGELIDRLRTLARELDSPVPSEATSPSKPRAAATKPAAPRSRSKPANA